MAKMKLSEVADFLDAELIGQDLEFEFVSIDSRQIKPGELFIAIKGPRFDGHEFIKQAEQNGAIAAVVTTQLATDLPQLKVKDSRIALGQIAAFRRNQLQIPVIAVTGSCGKTSTKELMRSILQCCGSTHSTQGTMNNDYGVPLTLLKLTDSHQYAVIEMGANHFEEIAYLTDIVRPSVAMITNAGPVHLEGFGNIYGVAQAKGEIFRGLDENGTAIINLDDPQHEYWQQLVLSQRKVTFGVNQQAQIRATNISYNGEGQPHFTLSTPDEQIDVQLLLLGSHNVQNALAAAAATYAIGIPLAKIKQGLEALEPSNGRLAKRPGLNGAIIIDDTYNANPSGTLAALKVLAGCGGEKVLVLGSMGELGDLAPDYHHELGEQAHQYGIKRIFAYGDLAHYTTTAFGKGASLFKNHNQLIESVKDILKPKMHVLVKGSRATHMETVVEALLATDSAGG